jgi:hypothetical protein
MGLFDELAKRQALGIASHHIGSVQSGFHPHCFLRILRCSQRHNAHTISDYIYYFQLFKELLPHFECRFSQLYEPAGSQHCARAYSNPGRSLFLVTLQFGARSSSGKTSVRPVNAQIAQGQKMFVQMTATSCERSGIGGNFRRRSD